MDRFYLENPEAIQPDEESDDLKLIAATGMKHEKKVLDAYRAGSIPVVEIPRRAWNEAQELTIEALEAKTTIIFQAALAKDSFAGFADFLILDERGNAKAVLCGSAVLLFGDVGRDGGHSVAGKVWGDPWERRKG
jgi:hypothetical protein